MIFFFNYRFRPFLTIMKKGEVPDSIFFIIDGFCYYTLSEKVAKFKKKLEKGMFFGDHLIINQASNLYIRYYLLRF